MLEKRMNNPQRIVGVTGGMGAGKSTLVQTIRDASVPVWDADAAVHRVYETEPFLKALKNEWPIEGNPRAYMAKVISQDPSQLILLEKLIGPLVSLDFNKFIADNVLAPFVVIDNPLLFESGWDKRCDCIIAIQCPIEIRKERCMKREGMTLTKFSVLTSRQISESSRLDRSHFAIHNDGDVETARQEMHRIIEQLKEFYK